MEQIALQDKKIQLSFEDTNILLELIRVATVRGALRAEELTLIGSLYEKLQKLMKEQQ